MTQSLSTAGGILILLVFVHFMADWLAQTETMAKRKADESTWLLVVHASAYAVIFAPFLLLAFSWSVHMTITCVLTLMMSHGAIDTYTPIWVWARFVRRPQEMEDDPVGGFTSWSSKPYGMVLTWGVDQFLHGCFLIPIAAMIVLSESNKSAARTIGLASFAVSIGLAIVSVATVFAWNKRIRLAPGAAPDDEDDRPSMPSQHDI